LANEFFLNNGYAHFFKLFLYCTLFQPSPQFVLRVNSTRLVYNSFIPYPEKIIMAATQISLAQFEILPGNPAANLEKVRAFAAAAHGAGSSLLLLPELWPTGFDVKRTVRFACRQNDEFVQELSAICCDASLAIGGSMLIRNGSHIENTYMLMDSTGGICASYQKTHLFQQMGEDQFLTPGEAIQMTPTFLGNIGMTICYDLRFPELYEIYARQGAGFIMMCAEWPVARIEQWKILIRARAIENRMFIAAVNCVGKWRDMSFGGHSALIAPDGTLMAEGGNEEELITGSLDLAAIDEIRKALPFGVDRRPELYARYAPSIK
jgi:predicted amidohydrolase